MSYDDEPTSHDEPTSKEHATYPPVSIGTSHYYDDNGVLVVVEDLEPGLEDRMAAKEHAYFTYENIASAF